MIIFFLPFVTLMACFSKELLLLFYGKQYVAFSSVFSIFCFSTFIITIGTNNVSALIAIGKPNLTREAALIRLIIIVVIIIPFIKLMNTNGAACANLFSTIIWFFFLAMKANKNIGISINQYFSYFLYGSIFSVIIIIIKLIL